MEPMGLATNLSRGKSWNTGKGRERGRGTWQGATSYRGCKLPQQGLRQNPNCRSNLNALRAQKTRLVPQKTFSSRF